MCLQYIANQQDLGKSATDALKSTGVDPTVVNSTTKTVTATADTVVATTKPVLTQVVTFLTTTEPVLLGEYALAALGVYLLGPTLLGALVGAARGYAGELTAAAALDQVCNNGNTVIVDIRTTREKEASGIPDLPVRERLVELDYATIDDRRVRPRKTASSSPSSSSSSRITFCTDSWGAAQPCCCGGSHYGHAGGGTQACVKGYQRAPAGPVRFSCSTATIE